jgi:hypothetical protein
MIIHMALVWGIKTSPSLVGISGEGDGKATGSNQA